MHISSRPLSLHNPFSTRFTRPGAIEYLFEDGQTATGLLERFHSLRGRAQIVGCHGSGKSTLLNSLVKCWANAGQITCVFALHNDTRHLPRDWIARMAANSARAIVIDGYEQLSPWSRWSIRAHCKMHNWGLLVTAHQDVGFATLVRTSPSLQVVHALVEQLARHCGPKVASELIDNAYIACDGNVRETLFALYDQYECLDAGT